MAAAAGDRANDPGEDAAPVRLTQKQYERELERLQIELLYMQEWVQSNGLRLVVLFEGRDTAGKGGMIKRITEFLNPRYCRVVALPAPTERELPPAQPRAYQRPPRSSQRMVPLRYDVR